MFDLDNAIFVNTRWLPSVRILKSPCEEEGFLHDSQIQYHIQIPHVRLLVVWLLLIRSYSAVKKYLKMAVIL